jgi:hypothetical protein
MTCKNFQGLVDGGAAENFDTAELEGIIAKRDFTCIIVGGRPERMWNLQPRKGLPVPRHSTAKAILKIFNSIKDLRQVRLKDVPTLVWLEGNNNAADDLKNGTSELLQTGRICFDGAGCGYVQRDRCFWGASDHCSLEDIAWKPPPNFAFTSVKQPKQECRLAYEGSKALPKALVVEDGFQLNFDPRDVVKNPSVAMDAFVREYSRKSDPASKSSPGAQARCEADSSRFPSRSYEMKNLVSKGDCNRVPNHRERLAMLGLPSGFLENLP